MKRLAIGLVTLAFVLFAVVFLVGDTAKTANVQDTSEPSTAPTEVDAMTAATQELQTMLEVVSNSVPVSVWTPAQPTAELVKADYCVAPEDDIWQISWSGAIDGSRETFDGNLKNVLANSPYELTAAGPDEYAILGDSGFNAGVRWNEEAGTIDLEFASACFQDVQPTE